MYIAMLIFQIEKHKQMEMTMHRHIIAAIMCCGMIVQNTLPHGTLQNNTTGNMWISPLYHGIKSKFDQMRPNNAHSPGEPASDHACTGCAHANTLSTSVQKAALAFGVGFGVGYAGYNYPRGTAIVSLTALGLYPVSWLYFKFFELFMGEGVKKEVNELQKKIAIIEKQQNTQSKTLDKHSEALNEQSEKMDNLKEDTQYLRNNAATKDDVQNIQNEVQDTRDKSEKILGVVENIASNQNETYSILQTIQKYFPSNWKTFTG